MNRGNHRQKLFSKPEDFALFLGLLAEAGERYEIKLWGYCLMGNHWHLVVEAPNTKELSQWMHWISNRHVRIFHQRNRRLGGGHIYQGRYKSFPIQDEEYLHTVLRYVEANPLRAKLVEEAQDWPWSSLSTAKQVEGIAELNRPKLEPWSRGKRWMAEVNHALPERELTAIRNSAQRGAPFGADSWVTKLAAKFGLESRPCVRVGDREKFKLRNEQQQAGGNVTLPPVGGGPCTQPGIAPLFLQGFTSIIPAYFAQITKLANLRQPLLAGLC